MCEFKNKLYGRNDRGSIDGYRYGGSRKLEVIRMILDTVPLGSSVQMVPEEGGREDRRLELRHDRASFRGEVWRGSG